MSQNKVMALDPKVVREIDLIVRGIETGKLKHDQQNFHSYILENGGSFAICGTAHCIAGWKVVRDTAKKTRKPIKDVAQHQNDTWFIRKLGIDEFTQWQYAQESWGLSDQEAKALFDHRWTINEIREAVNHLIAGERLVCTVIALYTWAKGEPYAK